MSTAVTVGHETVTVTQLQTSQDLSRHLAAAAEGGHSTEGLSGILQHHQQQQSLVMATPVTSQHQVGRWEGEEESGKGGGGRERARE